MLIGARQKKFAVQEIATVAARPRNDTVVCTQYNIVSLRRSRPRLRLRKPCRPRIDRDFYAKQTEQR